MKPFLFLTVLLALGMGCSKESKTTVSGREVSIAYQDIIQKTVYITSAGTIELRLQISSQKAQEIKSLIPKARSGLIPVTFIGKTTEKGNIQPQIEEGNVILLAGTNEEITRIQYSLFPWMNEKNETTPVP
jgi:hypothetical protein